MRRFVGPRGRRWLRAGCTVLIAAAACKPAWRAAAGPEIAMRPLSDIQRQSPPTDLPPLHFTDLSGAPASLADFAGKKVVLNFWATWCAPCVAELPELDKLAAGDPAIVVLVVSTDRGGAAAVKPFAAAHGITHAQILLDPGSAASHALGIAGYPTTLLIDGGGKLRGKMEGPTSWSEAASAVADVTKK